eukprot:XP_011680666.1 PREDICTED: integrator complex subunit 12 [Strongylocentrotus purpuratus]
MSPRTTGGASTENYRKRPAEKSSFGAALSTGDSGIAAKKPKIEPEVRQSRIQPRKPVIDDDDDDEDDDDDDDDQGEEDDDETEDEQTEEKEEKMSESSGEEDDEPEFIGKEEEKPGAAADDDEMWLGLACVVCKDLEISAGNTLIECQECHNLYHQKCHTPPVTDTDPNDPRLVWYCAQCKRNMKKMVAKKPANLPETVITTGSSSSSSSSSSSAKDQEKNQDQTSPMNLFRRADPKPSPTSTSSAPAAIWGSSQLRPQNSALFHHQSQFQHLGHVNDDEWEGPEAAERAAVDVRVAVGQMAERALRFIGPGEGNVEQLGIGEGTAADKYSLCHEETSYDEKESFKAMNVLAVVATSSNR